MARIRSVHPGLFTDEAFVSLSMTARVLLIGIWTECDDHGVFEWKPVSLKMRLMPADTVAVPELLEECLASDAIKRFSSGKDYGVVRNFCRYQRPKEPKYTHPIPPQFFIYAGLNKDGAVPLLKRSRTTSEKSPQREDGGGELEEESGNGIEEREGVKPARSDLKLVVEEKPIPIDASYEPSDRAVEYAFSLGMKKIDLTSELSKFIALSMASKASSYNPDMSFKAWCDRWLDFKRQKDPEWKPAPEILTPPAEPYVLVIHGTLEATCHNQYNQANGLRPLFFCKQIKDGVEVIAARCKTQWPPGYNDFGERVPPSSEEDAA